MMRLGADDLAAERLADALVTETYAQNRNAAGELFDHRQRHAGLVQACFGPGEITMCVGCQRRNAGDVDARRCAPPSRPRPTRPGTARGCRECASLSYARSERSSPQKPGATHQLSIMNRSCRSSAPWSQETCKDFGAMTPIWRCSSQSAASDTASPGNQTLISTSPTRKRRMASIENRYDRAPLGSTEGRMHTLSK
jgi:hypothetical protein